MTMNADGTGRSGSLAGRIGVCSWSLQPRSAAELAARVRATGLAVVQLALDPLRTGALPEAEVRHALAVAGVDVVSGMMAMAGEDYSSLAAIRRTGGVAPAATRDQNGAAATANARLARALGISLVTFHAGFVPHAPADPARAVLLARIARIAEVFAAEGVRVALETGQEAADTLLALLPELAAYDVGVNFDPANMILYGMGDPVAALERLAPWVRQVHIKDALPAVMPGEWGTEVPAGQGAVDWPAFFRVLAAAGVRGDLLIERESGSDRVGDIRQARALVEGLTGSRG
ncbi:MAG: sugar phosphate isomerase/epimerase [Gemmatimonadetes bacterium]|nr:sugar phosphate isomerase/epimerase [Gemmatimonadota bacterium]